MNRLACLSVVSIYQTLHLERAREEHALERSEGCEHSHVVVDDLVVKPVVALNSNDVFRVQHVEHFLIIVPHFKLGSYRVNAFRKHYFQALVKLMSQTVFPKIVLAALAILKKHNKIKIKKYITEENCQAQPLKNTQVLFYLPLKPKVSSDMLTLIMKKYKLEIMPKGK